MANETDIGRAKRLFDKMPLEVFNLWIVPGIERYGWQFSSVFESVDGTGWDGFFATRPLAFWATADWKLCQLPLRHELLQFYSRQRIHWIIDNVTKGVETPTANLHNTKERFRSAEDFIRAHGVFLDSAVGYWFGSQIGLVDGHHRLAALFHIGFEPGFVLPIWIASESKEENLIR